MKISRKNFKVTNNFKGVRYFLTIFGSIYLALWACIEPIGLFGLGDKLNKLGVYGYVLLIFFSFVLTFVSYKLRRPIKEENGYKNKSLENIDDKPPKTIYQESIGGRFSVLKIINESDNTSIYKVVDVHGQTYVVKKLKAKFCSFPAQQELLQISHPNLLPPIEYWTEGDYVYEKFPYFVGWRVSEILEQSEYGFRGAFLSKFIDDLTGAIKIIHDRQIIHRDINPDNIIFVPNLKKFILIDCSFAVKLTDSKQTPVGRTGFSDKYQLSGKASIGSDLYSLGATLYYVAHRKNIPPFEERETSYIDPDFPTVAGRNRLPKGVSKLLETDINKRFNNVQEFLNYIKPPHMQTEPQTFYGMIRLPNDNYILMIRLPNDNYILMGHASTEYLSKEELLEFAQKQASSSTEDSILTKEFFRYLYFQILKKR